MATKKAEDAFAKTPDGTKLILQSDQSWRDQHKRKEKGIRQSMSRKGSGLDHAVIENFFGRLKSELFYLQKFASAEHCKAELIDYLDHHNNRRAKAKLKGLSPAMHRKQALLAA